MGRINVTFPIFVDSDVQQGSITNAVYLCGLCVCLSVPVSVYICVCVVGAEVWRVETIIG